MGVTVMSTKGQVVVPKAVRDALNLKPGARLVVETRNGGVFLREEQAKPFPPKTLEEVFGSVKYDGPPLTLEDMDRAIQQEIEERFRRGRY